MARFDVYRNPNRAATHPFFVDVQSDLVMIATRWCIPLYPHHVSHPLIRGIQAPASIGGLPCVMDTPNLLAVPTVLLRDRVARLAASEQAVAEACIEFMLRGY